MKGRVHVASLLVVLVAGVLAGAPVRASILDNVMLTVFTDGTEVSTIETFAPGGRLVARTVERAHHEDATPAPDTSAPPTQAARCADGGTYAYVSPGTRRSWRMPEELRVNPAGAPAMAAWRSELLEGKAVWEQTRNGCGIADTIAFRNPVGPDSATVVPAGCPATTDGENTLGWADMGGWNPGLVLGRACMWWISSWIIESDIVFNNNAAAAWCNACSTGFDLRSISSHEFGHHLGLGHVQPSATFETATAVMHPYIFQGDTRNRTLSRGDIDGASNLYPIAFGYAVVGARAAGPSPMTPGTTTTIDVDVRNTGFEAWTIGGTVALSTAPAGRCSAFVGSDWNGCTSAGVLDADMTNDQNPYIPNDATVVAAGETARFHFTAPLPFSAEGTDATESFVVTGAPFASSPIAAVPLSVGTLAASVVGTSGPWLGGLNIGGVVVPGVGGRTTVEIRNTGTASWPAPGALHLVTDPAGRCSRFAGPDWSDCTDVGEPDPSGVIQPGETATFTFIMLAPLTGFVPGPQSEVFDVSYAGRPERLGARATISFIAA